MTEHNKMLNSALKLYETGKSNYTKDKTLARKCFMLSLETLTKLKGNNIDLDIIQTTEIDCIKMLNNTENIFDLVSKNKIDIIKDIKNINFREINSKGNTILHHAIDVGDTGIIKELLKKSILIDSVNGNGHTLLEYACLKKDPNIIHFLATHGANIEKHLFFRKGDSKYYLNKCDIDIAILLKLVVSNTLKPRITSIDKTIFNQFDFLEKYINPSELIGLDKFTMKDLINGLNYMFYNKPVSTTFKQIILEEIETYEQLKTHKLCNYNIIDILLSNMIPFINYPFNISSNFILKNEIKYLIKHIIKTNKKDFKNILLLKLFDIYIQNNLFPEDYIGIIVFNILYKIKL
jgi:hypothetical protein